jgi:ferrochelatase
MNNNLQNSNGQSATSKSRTGILLINLGTPDAPRTPEVRAYLRALLSCDRVLDINPVGRWLLLNLIILPFRPRKSAKAYRKIWMEEGSPLLVYSQKLKNALAEQFSTENIPVELGMQCGQPSLKSAVERLRKAECDRIIVLPMYPQYSSSTYGSAVEDLYKEILHDWNMPQLQIIPPFFSDSRFIEAWTKVGLPFLENNPDHVLFSFHSLPIRHLQKSDRSENWCKNNHECCLELVNENRHCYSAQCYHTAKLLAERYNLSAEKWSISFQSRFGRDEWIKPDTEQQLARLAESGVKSVVVFCPAFVADSLETLEEIGIRAAEHFRKHGGEELKLIPSLNDHPEWIHALTSIIRQQLAK